MPTGEQGPYIDRPIHIGSLMEGRTVTLIDIMESQRLCWKIRKLHPFSRRMQETLSSKERELARHVKLPPRVEILVPCGIYKGVGQFGDTLCHNATRS